MCFQVPEELKKLFREANTLYWAKALFKLTYNVIDRALQDAAGPPPFDIPHVCFVEAGLALSYSQTAKISNGYIVEELIDVSDNEFIKFIHNSDPLPLPDQGEPGYEIGQFLAFTQHTQYIKTGGQVYISDYQGNVGHHPSCSSYPNALLS
ncbi:hypothetical protein PAXINDRAFT_83131 [Paxillus involutus ATCC 200175]|uniref:Alpha-type protein kinase domain-containing protein n=1 Tax=Paxillus involutus ATCC 200175 TaxID=664439 RepID=A0A0C9STR0_PAXIN|nr:hypothetical protein PAXINDRAFT_83131 [Paxillus involutus ATCC 200175]